VSIVSSGSNTTPPNEGSRHFPQLVGRTGAGVSGVTLLLADGRRVTATCANGWFLAWWPEEHHGIGIEVITSSGASPQRLGESASGPGAIG
jgi:flavin reductase (DIM6/NTAB) family NADH-FMN oxidoreductase RutF